MKMKIKNFYMKNTKASRLVLYLLVLVILLLQYVAMQYSSISSISILLHQSFMVWIINIMVLFCFTLTFKLFCKTWYKSFIISTLILFLWVVANYFTVKYHGSPLFISEFANLTTALNVVGNYSYAPDKYIFRLLFLFILMVITVVFLYYIEDKNRSRRIKVIYIDLFTLIITIITIYLLVLSPLRIKHRNTMTTSWKMGMRDYGIGICLIEDVDKKINYMNVPNGYNSDYINSLKVYKNSNVRDKNPDIILIINETFYDLDSYTDTQSDINPLENFYSLDNAIYGKAVESLWGGGTNNSEFEVLTNNSMWMLQLGCPFNYYNFSKNKNNNVQFLKSLNYSTVAMHCATSNNYSRKKAYPLLGFDEMHFESDFSRFNTYGNRKWLDSDNYADLIDYYNAMGENSRFMYLLTLQNHGGYEQNDDSLDIVHTSKDYGDLTDDINEYLTSVKMSGDAFVDLTKQFEDSDRPTVIVMIGDHGPSFINELHGDNMSPEEENIMKRAVPYVIWSNFDLDTNGKYTEFITTFNLMPMVYDMAGMPITTYHHNMLDVHDKIPVITMDGKAMDKDGNITSIDGSVYKDDIYKYLYMEYNALNNGSDYRKELYEFSDVPE